MTATRRRRLSMLAACWWNATAVVAALAGPVDSFDDVVFWTGAGANRAAMVIDFVDSGDADPALVWGFRWDGEARGRHMLDAVLAADARLYGKIGNQPTVFNAILGLGYDRNDDGAFAVVGETFDANGVAFGGPFERLAPSNPADWYREGWDDTFWHYGVANTNPWTTGAWASSQGGASSRLLGDGAWDSWALSSNAEDPPIYDLVFAENPVAATPPGGYADFDDDHDFDGADLLAWQRGLGAAPDATSIEGDANGDGDVDAADLASWTAAFGNAPAGRSVPEPGATTLVLSLLVLLGSLTHLRRNV